MANGRAIQTNIAPAITKSTNVPKGFTNIPSSVGERFQFHELGPGGEVIDDPQQFAQQRAKQVPASENIFTNFEERLKMEMGDPYSIDVRSEAKGLLRKQEHIIFQEWSGGMFGFGGYLPPKAKKEWGEYKQRLLGNAEKLIQDQKEASIKEYEHRLTSFKTNEKIRLDREKEERLGKPSSKERKGDLTMNQISKSIKDRFALEEDQIAAELKFNEFLDEESKVDVGVADARQKAYVKFLKWHQKILNAELEGELDAFENDGLIPSHGKPITRNEEKTNVEVGAPKIPAGFKDTGRTSGGNKVYYNAELQKMIIVK